MVSDGYVGVDFVGSVDITPAFTLERRASLDFLADAIDRVRPGQKKGALRAHAGNLLNLAQGISTGDVVVAPLRDGAFAIGTVTGSYEFHPGTALPHRRPVDFLRNISREDMSDALRSPMRSIGTLFNLDEHGAELENLISGVQEVSKSDSEVVFGMEKQLEDWSTFVKSFVVPDEAVEWVDGEDALRTREALSYRTAKKLQTIKKAPATEKHPEQVDVVTVDAIVGTYTTVKLSGAMPARQKREHAERAAKLLDAVRAARERAATTPIVRKEIGRAIFQFLLK